MPLSSSFDSVINAKSAEWKEKINRQAGIKTVSCVYPTGILSIASYIRKYIPDSEIVESLVKDNEPNIALFGGNDGLKFYRVIVENAHKIAKEKFIMAFEHGYNKNDEIEQLILKNFPNAKIIHKKDLQGKDRMTFAIVGDFNE